MIAEIILIPDSSGSEASKSSARYVARGLASVGMKVREHISVCPDSSQFQQAVSVALSRSNVLVTLGGMGMDSGFLAKTILSRGLGLPLEQNVEALAGIRAYCSRTGDVYEPRDSALAQLPRGAAVFPGSCGKLPGCALSSAKQHIIMLPENHAEIAPMFNKYVRPYLGGSATTTVTRTLRVYGMLENAVIAALGDIMNSANPAVTVQKEGNESLVRVSAHADTPQQAAALCTPALQDIVKKLGDSAYGLDVDSLQEAVVSKLNKKDLDLAVAEGGTGGMLTRVLSETPGGQDMLRYTVSVDTTEVKEQKLGIKQKLLKKHGNVSEYAAVAAASAVKEKAKTKVGVAVLANTDDQKSRKCPIGVVYIAVCGDDNVYVKKLVVGDGGADADIIVDAALSRALNMTRLVADYYPGSYTAAVPLEDALDNPGITEFGEHEEESVQEPEPTSFWGRFLGNFTIRKSDGRGVKVRKFIFILAMLIFLGSGSYVGWHYYSAYRARKQAEDLQNMFMFGEMGDIEVSPDYPKNYSLKFAGLWNVNRDVAAFISVEDTGVRYPVVQSEDNDYYLRRDFYGNSNKYGIPFMDYRVDLKKPSDNIVVYGHNMMDGQIFGELIDYKKLDYYQAHPIIDLTTVYNENKYKVFSVFITNAYESQGPVFAYHDFIDAKGGDDFARYVDEIRRRSLINTTVDVKEGDELLTLSTCTYEFKDARFVIVARALRRGESEDVDTDGAGMNPSPLMPDIWYQTFGGSKPVGDSVTEIVTTPTTNNMRSSSIMESISTLSISPGSQSELDEALASEAEARAESRREQSRLAEESRVASSKAAEEASRKAAEEASKKAAEEAASKAAEEASKKAAEEAASKAAEEEASRLAEEEASRLAEEEASRLAEEEASRKAEEEAERAAEFDSDDEGGDTLPARSSASIASVSANGNLYKNADELDIISRIVQLEIGSTFEEEAIKAQAVAAYSFIANHNARGLTPSVGMASQASQKVVDAVSQVIGDAIYYKGSVAFTPYHATSAGTTTSSASVWGGSYPYLVSVDSSVDTKAPNFKSRMDFTREKIESLLRQKLGITASGDPSEWFEVLTNDGEYNGDMAVCGETRSKITGNKITGRMLRESVLGLRSASFEVEYDPDNDRFIFTTYGYGHGVGMSQNGANLMARQGLNYIEILQHYYPGTEVQ